MTRSVGPNFHGPKNVRVIEVRLYIAFISQRDSEKSKITKHNLSMVAKVDEGKQYMAYH